MLCCCVVFFFFKQKTAYELRISDWSSDVCSSDLDGLDGPAVAAFEKAMIDTPRYITAIRNWRVTRVTSSRGGWTLCLEQEVPDASVFVGDYLNHPYHWAVVERLFHPDAPEIGRAHV